MVDDGAGAGPPGDAPARARRTAGRSSHTRRWRRAAASRSGRRRAGRRVVAQPGHLRRSAGAIAGRARPRPGRRARPARRGRRLLRPQRGRRRGVRRRAARPGGARHARCRCCGAGRTSCRWAPFASAMTADVAATLDAAGRLTSWTYDVYSQGHTARPGYAGVPGLLAATTLAEPAVYPRARRPAGRAAARAARATRCPATTCPTGGSPGTGCARRRSARSAMRALGAYLNVFAIESFLDEAAALAGARPAGLPARAPRPTSAAGACCETAATAAGWGRRAARGHRPRPRLRPLQGHGRVLRGGRRGRGGDRRRACGGWRSPSTSGGW